MNQTVTYRSKERGLDVFSKTMQEAGVNPGLGQGGPPTSEAKSCQQ